MDYQSGLCFVNFLIVVFGISDSQYYSVDLDEQLFDTAQTLCGSNGFLANIPDDEETVKKILKVIEDKGDRTSTSFWIGLKKEKTMCVQENLPLKGFYWTVDNTTNFALNKWKTEPSLTCTNALCGFLSVEYRGSTVASWGLAAMPCQRKLPFICKNDGSSKEIACSSPPNITGIHEKTVKKSDPYTIRVSCKGMDTFVLTCSRKTGKWKLVGGTEIDIQGLCIECKPGYKKNKDGSCVDVDECQQPNICQLSCTNTVGSYMCGCKDDEDSEQCKEAKKSLITPAPDAFNNVKDTSTSTSMDKKPIPSTQPAVQSTTKSVVLNEASTGDLSNIVIPLIIALLIFVVLVVIIVAIVKYCLMRRAKKRAKKRAADLKESVALNGSDSMEKVNE
ncbi:C-type lectin domain family 14 member A precursor [Silurus asotus]|uniref:C-type lectin domain family 14 member A n=1 Tax=Silurus asotus TaxID=30991 RepID=A0AAD5A7K1_SILAS|nr:C-type lectin domain family 14 member A precursor [Silurus asotus]